MRKVFLDKFFFVLRDSGLTDRLTASPLQRLTVPTDFERTFSYSLGRRLAELYRRLSDILDFRMKYAEHVSFGCKVHAKRIFLKTSIS